MAPPLARTQYDVGLSFSGINRPFIQELDFALKSKGVRTFLDSDHTPHLAGEELSELLPDIYKSQCNLYVPLISTDYVASYWARREKRAALEHALKTDGYVFPIRLDDSEVPGISSTIGFIRVAGNSIDAIADAIATKLLLKRTEAIFESHGKLSVNDFAILPSQLDTRSSNIQCPLGQAHLVIACQYAIQHIQSRMHDNWINNPSIDKYVVEQPFPFDQGNELIRSLSSTWPSYQLQITFIDDLLNVLSHLDLPFGYKLVDSNLPSRVKKQIEMWVSESEDYQDEAITPFIAWSDNMSSPFFSSLSTTTRAILSRRSIGTLYPNNMHGSK